MQDLSQYLSPHHFLDDNIHYYQTPQWGNSITHPGIEGFDIERADIVLIGCGEQRGNNSNIDFSNGCDAIRKQFYDLYRWHPSIRIADFGNIIQGATMMDTAAALRVALHELALKDKTVIVLGGSHDLTLQQYEAFRLEKKQVNITVADMLIDLEETETVTSRSFLMDILTDEPTFARHYSHLGFQSYYVHPHIIETLDKLRFDLYRLGTLRENMEDAEPVLRASDIFSFDISAVRYSDAPCNIKGSPNGFTGDEACQLARYAGMSDKMKSFGIYGYDPENDMYDMSAKLIAQMMWYFADGRKVRNSEAGMHEREEFIEFHVSFTSNDTTFLKSKRTNRWWMQLPDESIIPCSYKDYLTACNDEIPERWLREQERLA